MDKTAYKQGDIIAGRYVVLDLLGSGGMGTVYLVQDPKVDDLLALKLLRKEICDEVTVKRFQNEVKHSRRQFSKYIVKVFEYGETDKGEYYLTMEYLKGKDLKSLLQSADHASQIAYPRALKILRQLALALASVHEFGILHRDIKPENIIVLDSGDIKLMDFGISKDINAATNLTVENRPVGSMFYMSPEAAAGKNTDPRSDIYSFGILAFELITGKLPFYSDNAFTLIAMHIEENIPKIASFRSGTPRSYQAFVEKCTAKETSHRFQSSIELVAAIEKLELEYDNSRFLLHASAKRLGYFISDINPALRSGAIAVLVSFLYLILLYPLLTYNFSGYIGRVIEPKMMDYWFLMRGKISAPPDVLMVIVNEDSYRTLGAKISDPIPRSYISELLLKLKDTRPKSIFLDFLYFDASEDRAIDLQLAEAIRQTPTSLAKYYRHDSNTWAMPLEIFSENAKSLINVNLGQKNMIARHFYYDNFEGTPRLPIAGLIEENKNNLPMWYDFINFYGPPGSIERVYFHEILKEASGLDPEKFQDKYILIGENIALNRKGLAARERSMDTYMTPVKEYMAGVEIHASSLANILQDSWIRRFTTQYEPFFVFFITSILIFSIVVSKVYLGALMVLFSFVIWSIISYAAFLRNYYIPGMLLFTFILPFIYILSLIRLFFRKKSTADYLIQ